MRLCCAPNRSHKFIFLQIFETSSSNRNPRTSEGNFHVCYAVAHYFQKKRKIVGQHNGHNVLEPVVPPKKLGIHGTNVAVDWDVCTGDGICIEVCSVTLFEWGDSSAHPNSEKSDPAREQDCTKCLACESQCPTQAIKMT